LLTQIRDAGNRAGNLTRQLLAFSRKQVLDMEAVDVNGVVSGFEKLMRRLIGEDVSLQMALHVQPLRVKADVSQVEQVLMNLAVNARDAMPEGGVLTIETGIIELDEDSAVKRPGITPGPYAMITVGDTGVGMDSETLRQIFEPFFTTKERDKGTGLGLDTSYGIIKQHSGDIRVYSEPGQGTTFKVYLPLIFEEEQAEARIVETPRSISGTGTVLVVEDDPTVLGLTGELLMASGYQVLQAHTPQVALEQARSHATPIDLVLSDVILPGMKGPELVEKIREIHPHARALYMSGHAQDVIAHHGILKKGTVFLSKPFTAAALREKVAGVLGQ
jgi:CheY-like chemotaxis protein